MTQNRKSTPMASSALAGTVTQVGCLTTLASIFIIGMAFAIGLGIDSLLGTKPWGLMICVFLSFPLLLGAIFFLTMNITKRLTDKYQSEIEHEKDDDNLKVDKETLED